MLADADAGENISGVRPRQGLLARGHKKRVVDAAVKDGVRSGRAKRRILKLSRSGHRYRAGQRSSLQQGLVKWIHALTDENPRHGYRRIAALLKQKGNVRVVAHIF